MDKNKIAEPSRRTPLSALAVIAAIVILALIVLMTFVLL